MAHYDVRRVWSDRIRSDPAGHHDDHRRYGGTLNES
jgi:hypothetical protein